MAESALRQLVPQSAEPFVRSYNPFNPAFRETIRATASDLLGGRAIGGTPSQRYRAQLADLLTGSVDFAPGVSDAVAVSDTVQAARGGDYGTAAILGGATMLGMVPVIGDSASKAIREGLDMSTAARMQRADEMGLNKSVFHGTHAEDITEIDPNEVDIGLHVGTPEQATNRLKDLSNLFSGSGRYSGAYRQGANILPLRVQASNPLKMSDVGDWKDSYQVLVGLRGNKAFAREASRIEDMLQEANEIAEQYANGDELWRDSMENRALLDEIRSMIQGKGYDSVKYLNQVENTYGSEGALTQAADAIIRDRLSAHDYLEAQIRKRMPIPPDPSDPAYRQKIDNYLNARLEDYASPDELQTMANLRNEISSIRNSPSSKNDPYSYIILDPANIRSVNAAFDPSKRNSANLMAGVGGLAVGLSALNQLVPRNEERQPD